MTILDGRVALVTGAGRGIGRATALELARRGADIAVVARSSREIEETAAAVRSNGRRACALSVDLADIPASLGLVAAVQEALGPISILVNNAGALGPFGPAWEIDPNDWERATMVNLVAPFVLSRATLPGMIEMGWGRIVNVSSGAAVDPLPRFGAYSPSKAGLDMLTRQLAAELEGTGVAVTTVYPGVVDTVMQAEVRSQSDETIGKATAGQFKQLHTDGVLRPPEESARLIVAVVLAEPSLNGVMVSIDSEEGERMILTEV